MSLSKRSEKLFDVALSVSQLSEYSRIKIGAVIVQKGDVISVGFNKKKSHPKQKKYNVYRKINGEIHDYIHAEMDAIIKAKRDLSGASIYISRKMCNGDLGMCRPCPACMNAIKESGIGTVFYTSEEGFERLTFK